ncbi:MAG: hypothetical protein ACJ71W_13695 [Terriglobales bacterium]
MEDLSDQIENITQELKALHAHLRWTTFQDADSGDQDRILNNLLNAGLGHDLKKAVDLLSQFLWCYIESAAARINAEGVDYAQQSLRLGPGHGDAPAPAPFSVSLKGVSGFY